MLESIELASKRGRVWSNIYKRGRSVRLEKSGNQPTGALALFILFLRERPRRYKQTAQAQATDRDVICRRTWTKISKLGADSCVCKRGYAEINAKEGSRKQFLQWWGGVFQRWWMLLCVWPGASCSGQDQHFSNQTMFSEPCLAKVSDIIRENIVKSGTQGLFDIYTTQRFTLYLNSSTFIVLLLLP